MQKQNGRMQKQILQQNERMKAELAALKAHNARLTKAEQTTENQKEKGMEREEVVRNTSNSKYGSQLISLFITDVINKLFFVHSFRFWRNSFARSFRVIRTPFL